MSQMKIVVGDWSGDGHGINRQYVVEYTGTIEQAREAHFNSRNVVGVNIDKLCEDYEDSRLPDDFRALVIAQGWEIEDYDRDALMDADEDVHLGADDIAMIWVGVLNLTDPSLDMKIIPEEKMPTLHFYGFDAKKRHISFVGYGVFSC